MSFAENYLRYKSEIEPRAKLITVSKGQSVNDIMQVYNVGCRDFGESRIQEALEKIKACPKDIRWHLIGTLQTKKVPKAIGYFYLIHSVDTPELAQKISQCSQTAGIETSILLQVNTSGELAKHGLTIEQWKIALPLVNNLTKVKILGFMTMAPHTDEVQIIKKTFFALKAFKNEVFRSNPLFTELSMGMTDDYQVALEEGASWVRIGSGIFC